MKNPLGSRWFYFAVMALAVAVGIAATVYRVNVCVGADRPWWC